MTGRVARMIRGGQRDEPTIQLTGLVQSIECSDLEIPNTVSPGGNIIGTHIRKKPSPSCGCAFLQFRIQRNKHFAAPTYKLVPKIDISHVHAWDLGG